MDVLTLGVHTTIVLSSCAGLASLSPRRGTLLIVSLNIVEADPANNGWPRSTPWGIILGLHHGLRPAISSFLPGDLVLDFPTCDLGHQTNNVLGRRLVRPRAHDNDRKTHIQVNPACLQKPSTNNPSFPYLPESYPIPIEPRQSYLCLQNRLQRLIPVISFVPLLGLFSLGRMARREDVDIPVYQYNNVSTKVEFYLVPQHPVYQYSSIFLNLAKGWKGKRWIQKKRHRGHTQTLNLTFLYVTVSTLNPTVGIVVTDWLSLSLYNIAGG